MAASLAASEPEEPKPLGWRLWRGLGKSNFGSRQGGGECSEGLGDVEWVLVVFVWVQLAQLGRTPTCLSLGGIE